MVRAETIYELHRWVQGSSLARYSWQMSLPWQRRTLWRLGLQNSGLYFLSLLYSTKPNHKPSWLGASIKPIIPCMENCSNREKCLPGKQEGLSLILKTHNEKSKTINTIKQYNTIQRNTKQNKEVKQLYALFVISALGRKRQANRFLRLTGPSLIGKC